MTRTRRGLALIVALLGFAAFASDCKARRHHVTPLRRHEATTATSRDFPVYVGTGIDRNPGGDNLYFSDTKRPSYIVGPAWFQRWQ
jgi:hypothetical protein